MKRVKVEMFEATDGMLFDAEEKCRHYESTRLSLQERLAHRGEALFLAAMLYDGGVDGARDLAAALEEAGRKCSSARIAAGDRKRKPKAKSDGASNVGKAVHQEPAAATTEPAIGPATALRPTRDNPFPIHAAAKYETEAE